MNTENGNQKKIVNDIKIGDFTLRIITHQQPTSDQMKSIALSWRRRTGKPSFPSHGLAVVDLTVDQSDLSLF